MILDSRLIRELPFGNFRPLNVVVRFFGSTTINQFFGQLPQQLVGLFLITRNIDQQHDTVRSSFCFRLLFRQDTGNAYLSGTNVCDAF